jgi:hypothetical protein
MIKYSNQDENCLSNYDFFLGLIKAFISTQNTKNESPNKVNFWTEDNILIKKYLKVPPLQATWPLM